MPRWQCLHSEGGDAVRQHNHRLQSYLTAALDAQKQGQLDRAAEIFELVLGSSPNHMQVLISYGVMLMGQNSCPEQMSCCTGQPSAQAGKKRFCKECGTENVWFSGSAEKGGRGGSRSGKDCKKTSTPTAQLLIHLGFAECPDCGTLGFQTKFCRECGVKNEWFKGPLRAVAVARVTHPHSLHPVLSFSSTLSPLDSLYSHSLLLHSSTLCTFTLCSLTLWALTLWTPSLWAHSLLCTHSL